MHLFILKWIFKNLIIGVHIVAIFTSIPTLVLVTKNRSMLDESKHIASGLSILIYTVLEILAQNFGFCCIHSKHNLLKKSSNFYIFFLFFFSFN